MWTVADIREEKGEDGSRRWIIAVNLRYPTGFEGYLGDLVYDGTRITELTDLELMRERSRQIAANPEREKKWNELKLPLYGQKKDNTCALACLRMVLAAFGTDVEESTLEGQAYLKRTARRSLNSSGSPAVWTARGDPGPERRGDPAAPCGRPTGHGLYRPRRV